MIKLPKEETKEILNIFDKITNNTCLNIIIDKGKLKISVIDDQSKGDLFIMDNIKIPYIRKNFTYEYKCPIKMKNTILT